MKIQHLKATGASLAICVLAIILEGALSGTNVQAYLATLELPPFSPPLWAWYAVGAGYYVTCFVVLYRVIGHGQRGVKRNAALALILVMMIANAAWNWAFFRNEDLFISFIVLVPYHAIAIALLVSLARVDRVASLALLPYAVYLTYADYWGYGVWRLNS